MDEDGLIGKISSVKGEDTDSSRDSSDQEHSLVGYVSAEVDDGEINPEGSEEDNSVHEALIAEAEEEEPSEEDSRSEDSKKSFQRRISAMVQATTREQRQRMK